MSDLVARAEREHFDRVVAALSAVESALAQSPPFGHQDQGRQALRSAVDLLTRARLYADVHLDVAEQRAGAAS